MNRRSILCSLFSIPAIAVPLAATIRRQMLRSLIDDRVAKAVKLGRPGIISSDLFNDLPQQLQDPARALAYMQVKFMEHWSLPDSTRMTSIEGHPSAMHDFVLPRIAQEVARVRVEIERLTENV